MVVKEKIFEKTPIRLHCGRYTCDGCGKSEISTRYLLNTGNYIGTPENINFHTYNPQTTHGDDDHDDHEASTY